MFRNAAKINAIDSSATPRALAPSALSTRIPSSFATPRGILSVPVPLRLITRSFVAARRTRSEIGSTPAIHPTHSGNRWSNCSSVGTRPGFAKINSKFSGVTIGAVTQASGPWTSNLTQVAGGNCSNAGQTGALQVGGATAPATAAATDAGDPLIAVGRADSLAVGAATALVPALLALVLSV